MSTVEVHKQITADEIAHTFEDEVPKGADLSQYATEDWLALAIFWIMALCVFLQFFTRYVLNDSYAWTEEIATYCLIGVVFIGSAMCVRLSRHIQVDLIFRYLPHLPARALSTVIDLIRIAFFGYAGLLCLLLLALDIQWPLVAALGSGSYFIYLWHIFIVMFLRDHAVLRQFGPAASFVITFAVAVSGSVVAWLTVRTVAPPRLYRWLGA